MQITGNKHHNTHMQIIELLSVYEIIVCRTLGVITYYTSARWIKHILKIPQTIKAFFKILTLLG